MNQFLRELKLQYPIITHYLREIECGRGWYALISEACENIETYVKGQIKNGLISLEDDNCTIPRISRITQKFGLLRIDVDNADDYINDQLCAIASESSKIDEYDQRHI